MSVDLIVYLRQAAMPSPKDWQEAIQTAEFPVELDMNFDPATFRGFLPCKFNGEPSGFEYFVSPRRAEEAVELGAPRDADLSVTLVTHSDLRELAVAVSAASALCRVSGGLLVDPQSGETYTPESVLVWAREQLVEIEQA
jgi:hypothetical protein